MRQKIKYLTRSVANFFTPVLCPNCGDSQAVKVDQKYFFTRLFECARCNLQFRHPVDSKIFNNVFYQTDYVQNDGITTDLPANEELEELIRTKFEGSNKNVGPVVQLFEALGFDLSTVKVVDYGCSWGYMTWQFNQLGIMAQGYEISQPRAEFGRKFLSLDIKTDWGELAGANDIVFSSHVIEHVPSIPDMIKEAKTLLKPEGLFIAESPNGSFAFRKASPRAFHEGWGLVHPNYLSEKFYQFIFKEHPFYITSTPYDFKQIEEWDGKSQVTFKTGGPQLLVMAKLNTNHGL